MNQYPEFIVFLILAVLVLFNVVYTVFEGFVNWLLL